MNDENKKPEITEEGGVEIKQPEIVISLESKTITIDDLKKVEIRVGQIKSAIPVEGSEKLLILKVDFGNEERQIVSGIAKYYSPDNLIGKKVPFVTNLEPRKLMGHESNGMIFAAKDSADHFSLLDVAPEIENGTHIS